MIKLCISQIAHITPNPLRLVATPRQVNHLFLEKVTKWNSATVEMMALSDSIRLQKGVFWGPAERCAHMDWIHQKRGRFAHMIQQKRPAAFAAGLRFLAGGRKAEPQCRLFSRFSNSRQSESSKRPYPQIAKDIGSGTWVIVARKPVES